MIYKFFTDKKYTIWIRDYFEIEADSKEDAISIIKDQFKEDGNDFYIEGESETLYDTEDFLLPEYNDYQPTLEIYDNETSEEILNNVKDG